MSAAKRIMLQWEVAVGTPPDHEDCWGAWSELICLSKRYKSIIEGMERRQTTERQCRALVVSVVSSFASTGGMGRTGGLGGVSSLKAVVERLKGRLDVVISCLQNVVAACEDLMPGDVGTP